MKLIGPLLLERPVEGLAGSAMVLGCFTAILWSDHAIRGRSLTCVKAECNFGLTTFLLEGAFPRLALFLTKQERNLSQFFRFAI